MGLLNRLRGMQNGDLLTSSGYPTGEMGYMPIDFGGVPGSGAEEARLKIEKQMEAEKDAEKKKQMQKLLEEFFSSGTLANQPEAPSGGGGLFGGLLGGGGGAGGAGGGAVGGFGF